MEEDALARRGSAEVGEEGDFVSVGKTKSRKACYRLVQSTGVDAQETEAPGRVCCGRPKTVNRVVMAN